VVVQVNACSVCPFGKILLHNLYHLYTFKHSGAELNSRYGTKMTSVTISRVLQTLVDIKSDCR
jgi:hypothetical protein